MTEAQQRLALEHLGYAERIARYDIPRAIRDRLGPDDVLALCLLGLCRAAERHDPTRDFLPFAKTCMRNAVFMAWKRERYQVQWTQLDDDGPTLAEVCRDCRRSDQEVGWLVEALERALGALRPRQRKVLRLHYLDGVPYTSMPGGHKANASCAQRALARLRGKEGAV